VEQQSIQCRTAKFISKKPTHGPTHTHTYKQSEGGKGKGGDHLKEGGRNYLTCTPVCMEEINTRHSMLKGGV